MNHLADGLFRALSLWIVVRSVVHVTDTGAVHIVWPMWVFLTVSGLFGLACSRLWGRI